MCYATSNHWIQTWGPRKGNYGNCVSVDSLDNIYVASNSDEIGYDDISYLRKYDPVGNLLWVKNWGGNGYTRCYSATVDSAGFCYVGGGFSETVDFDPGIGVDSHTSNGVQDTFLVKFNADGKFQWARTWGGISDDGGIGPTSCGPASIGVVGGFMESVDFDPGPGEEIRNAIGDGDVYISMFDLDGNFKWVNTWGSTDLDWGLGCTTDGQGNTYVTGFFEGPADFDPSFSEDERTPLGDSDAFVSKFNSDGAYQWALTWGGESRENAISISCNGIGSMYIHGGFRGVVDFDPGIGEDYQGVSGDTGVFLSKFNLSGEYEWARTWKAYPKDFGFRVSSNSQGDVYCSGTFSDSVDFDPGPGEDVHTPFKSGNRDAFLSKFDSTGDHKWTQSWGGMSPSVQDRLDSTGIALDSLGNIYATGWFYVHVDFDPGPGEFMLDSSNSHLCDAYLSRFSPNGDW